MIPLVLGIDNMAQKKESFFWTSYTDLMTSLFFVMLVLFVLVIILLRQRVIISEQQRVATEEQLMAIQSIENSTKDLDRTYFNYNERYKKYILNIEVQFPKGSSDIRTIIHNNDVSDQLFQLRKAGMAIQRFLEEHPDNQYLLIVEGQASKDAYFYNYELSYQRALSLTRFWIEESQINFAKNCEMLIAGSGDGRLETHSIRESNEWENQRFLIHILPKNIFEESRVI